MSILDEYAQNDSLLGQYHDLYHTLRDAQKQMSGLAMDEGEKQANYEMSFQIVFTLNQIVLPGLYLFLFVVSMLLQERQITAFLVVAFLHIYINVMQVRMIRRYFK